MPLAEAAVESFGTCLVEPVIFTSSIKAEMAENLRIKVEDQHARIPVDHDLRNDWHSVRRIMSAGSIKYDAARDNTGHADRFWAAALGVRAAGNYSGPPEYVGSNRKLIFAREGIW